MGSIVSQQKDILKSSFPEECDLLWKLGHSSGNQIKMRPLGDANVFIERGNLDTEIDMHRRNTEEDNAVFLFFFS